MTEIGPIGGGASAQRASRPQLEAEARAGETRPGDRAQTRSARRGADRVEVSSLARELSQQQEPVRQDLIDRVRAEIDSGSFETDRRVDGAIDRIMEDLGPGR
ncbi:MAG: flagellar biosynthesis anti-sigma factor FlgM [Planctomycetota bacterium]|nr:flagellar biosynthesis anti-sigma factor FlgM [Planctomycetota bacterium]